MTNLFSVADQVVCITGSSRGLGKTLARAFAEHGAKVVLTSFNEPELQQTYKEFKQSNLEVTAVPCDVSRTEDCKKLIERILEKFGKIDTCICNAGTDIIKPATEYSEEEWDKILNVNLRGAYMCAKFAAIEMILRKSGNIIMTFIGPYIFLASKASSYVTGHILQVDGGYSCW